MTTERIRLEVPSGPRIAVVDDDPFVRKFMTTALQRRGFDARPFNDGADALLAIRRGEYALVVSDLQMPRLDGIGLTRALRRDFDRRSLPILLVSVNDEEDVQLRAYEAGVNDYLVKPLALSVLVGKVQALLREPSPSELPPWSRGGKLPARFDRWVLEREIGRGGMGIVFQGRRVADGELDAVKVLNSAATADRTALARYFREVCTMREVLSPHLVRYVGAGHADGQYYLAMELVPGRSAQESLMLNGPLDIRRALSIGADVCRAIAALLERGLVHRDVKPANVVVRPDGRAVLVDLGLAKRPDEVLTEAHDVIGTAEFIAPEVVFGELPDAASELYSVGATLYYIISGELPLHGDTPQQVLRKAMEGERPPPLSRHRPDVPREVEAIVDELLAKEPRKRGEPSEVAARLDELARTLK